MNPIPSPNKLSPWVQALLAAAFALMFAGLLFMPAWCKDCQVESDVKQTLFTVLTAVVFFFIGKNTDSARREDALAAAAIANVPPPPTEPTQAPTATPGSTSPPPKP